MSTDPFAAACHSRCAPIGDRRTLRRGLEGAGRSAARGRPRERRRRPSARRHPRAPARAVTLVSGHGTRDKVVELSGLEPDRIARAAGLLRRKGHAMTSTSTPSTTARSSWTRADGSPARPTTCASRPRRAADDEGELPSERRPRRPGDRPARARDRLDAGGELRADLAEIDAALARIDVGTYGLASAAESRSTPTGSRRCPGRPCAWRTNGKRSALERAARSAGRLSRRRVDDALPRSRSPSARSRPGPCSGSGCSRSPSPRSSPTS